MVRQNDVLTATRSFGMYSSAVSDVNTALYRKVYEGQPSTWWSMFGKNKYLEAARVFEDMKAGSQNGHFKYDLDEGVDEDTRFDPFGEGLHLVGMVTHVEGKKKLM